MEFSEFKTFENFREFQDSREWNSARGFAVCVMIVHNDRGNSARVCFLLPAESMGTIC